MTGIVHKTLDIERLKNNLCNIFCAEIGVYSQDNNLVYIDTPFTFSDGDTYSIYLQQLPDGSFRISDFGNTLMRISYEHDLDSFSEGTRQRLLEQILSENKVNLHEGAFYLETSLDELGKDIFRFGQTITQIFDLTFLSKIRVESTFYEDVRKALVDTVGDDRVIRNYVYTKLRNAEDYPIDFYIKGNEDKPLFVFGVPNRDKARLATIVLQHFINEGVIFDSLIIFQDQKTISRSDLARLTNVADEMVSSLDEKEVISRKLIKLAAA